MLADDRAGNGDQHLQRSQAEDDQAQATQLGQVEFEPDREHQEDHAELGQIADAGAVAGQGQRMRPDQYPDDQITEDRRQLQITAQHDAQHGSDQVQQGQIERIEHGLIVTVAADFADC